MIDCFVNGEMAVDSFLGKSRSEEEGGYLEYLYVLDCYGLI